MTAFSLRRTRLSRSGLLLPNSSRMPSNMFPAPRSGKIVAQARRRDPGRLEVSIKDDGIGMASFREGSLGYGLVRSLVERISGTIAVQSDPGLAVPISFPDTIGQPTGLLEIGSSLQLSPRNGGKGR